MFRFLKATNGEQLMAERERFVEFWYGARRPEFGEPHVLTLYPDLPGSLRRFYAFAGRWPSPDPLSAEDFFYAGQCGHHLLPLDAAAPECDGRLRFFMEYQGDWYGVTNSSEADPPVWIRGRWEDEGEEEGVRQVSEALSKFLVTHCLMATVYETCNSPRPRTHSHSVDTALAEWFRGNRESAELLWEAEPDGCPNYEGSFYLLHEHVLVHDTGTGFLKFGALQPEGVELLRVVLGDAA